MREVPVEKVKEYCCEDIDYTTRLKELFEEELEEKKLDRLLNEIELPLLLYFSENGNGRHLSRCRKTEGARP